MREAKINGQRRNGSHTIGAKSTGAGEPILAAATSAQPESSPADRSDWRQVTFRAPRNAKKFLEVLCAEQDVTIQKLGLQWLQSLGAPVCEADLDDQRTSESSARIDSASAKEGTGRDQKARNGGPHEAMPDLRFLADLAKLANGHGVDQAAPVIQVYFVNVAGDVRSSK